MNIYKAMVYAKSPRTGLDTAYFVGFVNAATIEEAIRVYEEDGMPWVTVVSGFEVGAKTDDIITKYRDVTNPREIVKGMDYDDFMDWLSISEDKKDIESAIIAFSKEGEDMNQWVLIMKQFLKDNYGDKSEEKEDGSEDSPS